MKSCQMFKFNLLMMFMTSPTHLKLYVASGIEMPKFEVLSRESSNHDRRKFNAAKLYDPIQ